VRCSSCAGSGSAASPRGGAAARRCARQTVEGRGTGPAAAHTPRHHPHFHLCRSDDLSPISAPPVARARAICTLCPLACTLLAGRGTICNGGNTRIGVYGPPVTPSSGESPRTLRQRVPALRASPSTTRASGEDGHWSELLCESGGDDRHSTVMQMAAGVLCVGDANSTGLMFPRTFEVRGDPSVLLS